MSLLTERKTMPKFPPSHSLVLRNHRGMSFPMPSYDIASRVIEVYAKAGVSCSYNMKTHKLTVR